MRVFSSSSVAVGLGLRTTTARGRLPPARILDGDDGTFADGGVAEQDILEGDGGDPFAAGFDDVLGTVEDVQHALTVDGADIAGMHPAAAPEGGGGFRVFDIAGGEAGGAGDDFTDGLAVMRHGGHVV